MIIIIILSWLVGPVFLAAGQVIPLGQAILCSLSKPLVELQVHRIAFGVHYRAGLGRRSGTDWALGGGLRSRGGGVVARLSRTQIASRQWCFH